LIPYIIDSIRNGRSPEIRSPDNRNDFIYVKDVARAFSRAIETEPKGDIYNIGSGRSTSVRHIVSLVSNAMKIESDCIHLPENGAGDHEDDFWADITRVRADLGWTPRYDIAEGIMEMIQRTYNNR
jgi:UDP-glucose 4-epimerase